MNIKIFSINRHTRRITELFKYFLKAEKEWCKVLKRDVVIYDVASTECFLQYLSDYGVIYVRGERLNLRVLAGAVLSIKFYKDPLFTYSILCLRSMKPRLILTTIDNDYRFFEISNLFPNAITIMVQNGVRDDILDVWAHKDKFPCNPRVDYMVVFGNAYGRFINKYIKGKVIVAGSYRSNKFLLPKIQKDRTILFISQISQGADSSKFGALAGGGVVTHFDFSRAEADLLPQVHRWCQTNGYQLKILARSNNIKERRFYTELLPNADWEYRPPNGSSTTYGMVDEAEIVVGIDSTLVLESLGRGNKTAVFSLRGNYIRNWPSVFWPSEPTEVGPFWTNSSSESEVNRVLSFLTNVDSIAWGNCLESHVSDHIIFDSNNSRLKSLISSIVKAQACEAL